MKSSTDNSPLDKFIKDALKAPDANLPPVDWSEVEVLLKHEKKPISLKVDKRTITYSGAGAGALLLLFCIVKIVGHYSSMPAETETRADSSQSTFSVIDTVKTAAMDSAIPKPTVSKSDTAGFTKNGQKIDSVPANAPADTALTKKIPVVQKPDKKKKQNPIKDTAKKPEIVPPPVIDTATLHPAQEIKIETHPAADTANKNAAAPKENSKRKRSIFKKSSGRSEKELPKSGTPAETKPDSLKQQ